MNDNRCSLFERVANKCGRMSDGLDTGEKKLVMSSIDKMRLAGTSGHPSGFASSGSSDGEFDKFLEEKFTPKTKSRSQKPCSAAKTDRLYVLDVESSDDDVTFEAFLERVKTPATKPKIKPDSGSDDSLKTFIVDDYSSDDDFVKAKSNFRVPKKSTTSSARRPSRKPLSHFNSPVFVSDSDEEDVVIRSSWKTRHSKPNLKTSKTEDVKNDEEASLPPTPSPASPFPFAAPPCKTLTPAVTPKRTVSAPSRLDESSGSEEEFASLLERLKKKNNITETSFTPKNIKGSDKENVASVPAVNSFTTPKSLTNKPEHVMTKEKTFISQTEPRHATSRVVTCKTPGCFLESLTDPRSTYGASFKKNKEELTGKIYRLYNSSVFDNKLPTNMSITWNKKMRKTAGYCVTGQEKAGGSRYARIELSVKVCDSADRLRDTLIHEMCHAATWLINGVRDGHGNIWKLYARKATLMHPELPVVTRCHSYDIKYKFQYQCTRCQNTIGRHSKSLDTQRFACALCTGQLILLTPSKPRGPTPFAVFVKKNYGNARQELAGQSHAEVMRKLSADFASKTKLDG